MDFKKRTYRTALLRAAGIVFFLLLWTLISQLGIIKANLFPSPVMVLQAMGRYYQSGQLYIDFTHSFERAVIGFVVGSLAGLFVGMVTGRIAFFNLTLAPVLNFLRSLPPVAILPLFIIWFGIDDSAKITAIAFGSFFPVWLNTSIGASRIPQVYIDNAKLLTTSRLKMIFKVQLPATLPYIIAGLRLSVATAFIMVFVSELAGSNNGIGYTIANSQMNYQIDLMTAALCLLAATAAAIDYGIKELLNLIFPWIKYMQ